ncbi:cob(I)yrinic acid a,c-diamide adenosyltransferase [Candidatus Parcubacteria bacterium]|nr:cob(I)yrinic acid a,c-diamide adenosyltransferase [Candidatus Parcubacteria bacterium]
MKNLIFIYTGNGKGKTSASLGLALRSLRDNKKVILIQFIKSEKESGEASLKKILSKLEVKCFGTGFIFKGNKDYEIGNREIIKQGIEFTKKIIQSRNYDVITLDEIFVALDLKLISLNDILELIKIFRKTNKKMFLVMTGRGCPESLYKYVDLITEMKEIKHPYQKGIMAIKGIDY